MDGEKLGALIVAAAAAFLLGCGSEEGSNNHGYGFGFDDEFNGLRVRYFDGGRPEPTAETLEAWFQETIKCADMIGPPERAGLPVSPPLVVIVPMGENDPFDGKTFFDTGTITIERQWVHDRGLFIHEFVHWLLHSRRSPLDLNHEHKETEFACRFV